MLLCRGSAWRVAVRVPAAERRPGSQLCGLPAVVMTHRSRWPLPQADVTPAFSLARLVYGSGMLWVPCYSAFSPLPFRLQLLGQGAVSAPRARAGALHAQRCLHACCPLPGLAQCLSGRRPTHTAAPVPAQVTAALLAGNRSVCASNLGLRRGYRTVMRLLQAAPSSLLALLSPGSAQRCLSPHAQQASLDADMQLCQDCQVALLLPAFAVAMWGLHSSGSERQLRLHFLRDLVAAQPPTPSGPQPGPASGAAGSGHGQLAVRRRQLHDELRLAGYALLPADVARLAADASLAPSSLDFLLRFCVPTVAALWSYAR